VFYLISDQVTQPTLNTLHLHDALPICLSRRLLRVNLGSGLQGPEPEQREEAADEEHVDDHEAADYQRRLQGPADRVGPLLAQHRSEEHTSELQSRSDLV